MKKILILIDCRYAQSKPHLPILSFVAGFTYPVEDYMATSMVRNGDGETCKEETLDEYIERVNTVEPESKETPAIDPEIKEKPQKHRGNKRNKS